MGKRKGKGIKEFTVTLMQLEKRCEKVGNVNCRSCPVEIVERDKIISKDQGVNGISWRHKACAQRVLVI